MVKLPKIPKMCQRIVGSDGKPIKCQQFISNGKCPVHGKDVKQYA